MGDRRALGAVEVLKAEGSREGRAEVSESDLRGIKTTPSLPRTSNSASAFFPVS